MRGSHLRWVRPLQYFFYAGFIVLWFKDNFPPIRGLNLSHWVALLPLLVLTGLRLFAGFREKQQRTGRITRKIPRETTALVALLLAAVIFRIPFLAHSSGMMTSDDAIPALMGKHIAEGKVPPVCFYGQLYMGSLSSHFFGLVFKVFGYSMLALKGATLFVFLAFMVVQFLLLRQVFSFYFALAVTFFYSLPFPQLVTAGLDNTSAYPLVLLLGAAILYLAYLISFKGRETLVPAFGFLAGLAFWTHQVTAAFILTGVLILLFNKKIRIKSFFFLSYFALLGFLPQLLSEVFNRFPLFSFLTSEKSAISWEKIKLSLSYILSLGTESSHPSRYLFLVLVFAGFLFLIARSVKLKRFLPETVFSLFFVIFYLSYILSYFSARPVVRYLYPLYVCLPALMLAAFLPLRPKWRSFLLPGLVAALFLVFNLRGSLGQAERTADRDFRIRRTAAAMEKTGCRYWLADYWTAYLFTAVSAERLVVDSYSINRYPAYSLAYWEEADADAYIFLFRDDQQEKAYHSNFTRWLERVPLQSKKREVGATRLFYDIKPRFYPRALLLVPPSTFPTLELEESEALAGYLELSFRQQEAPGPGAEDEFRLIAEIPEFSLAEQTFSTSDKEVRVALPYPKEKTLRVRYHLDYRGVVIPSSTAELEYTLPDEAVDRRSAPVVFLRGIGPEVDYQGKKRRICEKDVSLEVNRPAGELRDLNIHISLCSPFQFSGWRWYGNYAQSVQVEVNGQSFGERMLKDGENVIDLAIPPHFLRESANVITLKFRHHSWFFAYPFWRVSAFLDRVEVD
ncbi:MAG: hypothetical protein QHH14_08690 [Clostridiales bacterium]|nr:hypothetical protein [Clostridiales bacterium]